MQGVLPVAFMSLATTLGGIFFDRKKAESRDEAWLACSSFHTPSWTCALSLAFCSLQTHSPVIVTRQKGQSGLTVTLVMSFSGPFAFTLVPPLFYAHDLCLCGYHCISCCRLGAPTSSACLVIGQFVDWASTDWLWLHYVVLDWVYDNSLIKHYFGCKSQILPFPSYLSNKMSSPRNSVGWSS